MNAARTRKLKSAAAYALWGLAAAGVLAAVLYVALARSGEANNPGDIPLPGGAEIITPGPPATPTPTPDSFLSGGIIGEPTATPDNPAKGGVAGLAGSSVSGESIGNNAGGAAPNGIPVITAEAQRHWQTHNSFTVSLHWTEVDRAVRYDVERDSGGGYVSLGWIDAVLVSESMVTDVRLKPDYRVRACADNAGQACGQWSAPAGAELRPLTAPTELETTVDGDIQTFAITLDWDSDGAGRYYANQGLRSVYQVERNTGEGWEALTTGAGLNAVTTVLAGNQSYTDTLTLREPVTAQYRVSLCLEEGGADVCGPAAVSESIELTPLLEPATPTGFFGYYDNDRLNPLAQGIQRTVLWWNAPAAGDRGGRIEVQIRLRDDANWGHLANVTWAAGGSPPNGYVDQIGSFGLSAQVQYRIRACNPAGCSGWSNTVFVTVYRTGEGTF